MAKSKVIKDFVKNDIDIVVALQQLKVLLNDVDKEEIKNWIDSELRGYKGEDEQLPDYRVCGGVLKGDFLNFNTKASNIAIPLSNKMNETMRELCTKVEFKQGVKALQELCRQGNEQKGSIGTQLPAEVLPYIQRYSNISMTCLLAARIEVSSIAVHSILSSIQNRILDILLLLEKEFGCLDNMDIDFSVKTKEDAMVIQNNIYNIIVDKHIEIGNENEISKSNVTTA